MRRKTPSLHPNDLMKHAAGNPHVYVSGDLAILRSLHSVSATPILEMVRSPQYVELGRVVLITAGEASFDINLVPYGVKRGDILLIPQHNYISIPTVSEDFDGGIISFSHNPVEITACMHLRPEPVDFTRICHYADLLWEVVQRPYGDDTVVNLQTAMLGDIRQLYDRQGSADSADMTRSRQIFRSFMDAHRSGMLPRSVKAYAEHLCISPNHLSAVIRKESGRSVMEWINDYCILRAQVMLRHTSLPVYEIAERLGFRSATFFTRFFRRETGRTPSDYRQTTHR